LVIETSDKAGSRIKAMDPVEAMPAEMKGDKAALERKERFTLSCKGNMQTRDRALSCELFSMTINRHWRNRGKAAKRKESALTPAGGWNASLDRC